jgi:hypothetical protein
LESEHFPARKKARRAEATVKKTRFSWTYLGAWAKNRLPNYAKI